MEPSSHADARARLEELGGAAAKMPTKPVADDVLSRLSDTLDAIYTDIGHMTTLVRRAELLDTNLSPEPDEVQTRPDGMYERPPNEPGALERATQVRDAVNVLEGLHHRLNAVLTRAERKLYGQG